MKTNILLTLPTWKRRAAIAADEPGRLAESREDIPNQCGTSKVNFWKFLEISYSHKSGVGMFSGLTRLAVLCRGRPMLRGT